jgi:hypothetical protein
MYEHHNADSEYDDDKVNLILLTMTMTMTMTSSARRRLMWNFIGLLLRRGYVLTNDEIWECYLLLEASWRNCSCWNATACDGMPLHLMLTAHAVMPLHLMLTAHAVMEIAK